MKCEFCGQENAEESRFCEKCGAELKKPENPDAGGTVQAAGAAVTKAADEAKKIISKIPKKSVDYWCGSRGGADSHYHSRLCVAAG